jgi:hypothetical protein
MMKNLLVIIVIILITGIESLRFSSIKKYFASTILVSGLALQPVIADNSIPKSTYINERYHTTFDYPKDFIASQGKISGDRIIEAFTDPTDSDTSVSVVVTGVPGDFTKLGSFGTGKDTLRDYLVPKNVQNGICVSEVLNENVKGETYTVEYTVECNSYAKKHLISVFALRPAESVIGLTIQTKESTYNDKKNLINFIAPSLNIHKDEM